MSKFATIIERLKKQYGEPPIPPARGPFELILWENAVHLLPDERRLEVFDALQEQVGLNAAALDAAPDAVLLPIAIRGGMRPAMRVFRWRQIATITLNQFGGNLDSILQLPFEQARKALKQFPNITDPAAERILLFCGIATCLPLDSNGLRVLNRIGWGRVQKNQTANYRSVQEQLRPEIPVHLERLTEAHLLLRIHGRTLCKERIPLCPRCSVANECRHVHPANAALV